MNAGMGKVGFGAGNFTGLRTNRDLETFELLGGHP